MNRTIIVPVLLLLSLSTPLASSSRAESVIGIDQIHPGDVVRGYYTHPDRADALLTFQGKLLRSDATSIEVLTSNRLPALRLDLGDVSELDVRTGGSHLVGAVVGGMVGFGLAVAGAKVTGDRDGVCDWYCSNEGQRTTILSVLFIPSGILAGSLLAPGARWRTVQTTPVKIGLGSIDGSAFGATLSARF